MRIDLLLSVLICTLFVSIAYAGDTDKEILTPAERLWLKENQSRIILAVETGYPPFVFLDSRGQPRGLAHEYMLLIESKLGVQFKEGQFPSLEEIFAKVRSGEVQIVNAVTKTPGRSEFLSFTDPFISVPNVIVVRQERSGKMSDRDLAGLKVSLVKSYAITEHLTKSGLGIETDLVPDDLAAILNVSFGRSDAAVVDLATATYLIAQKGITNLRVAGEASLNIQLSIGVPHSEAVLRGILQKGLNAITQTERDRIQERWINAHSDRIFTARFWIAVASVGAAIFLVMIGILLWNRTLRRLVAIRTEDLVREKEALKLSEEALQMTRVSVDAASDAIFWITPDARFVDVNPAACRSLGYTREELLQLRVQDVDPHYSAEVWQHHFPEIRKCGTVKIESEHLTKDNRVFPVEIVSNYVQFGAEERNCAFVRDITERKNIETALRQSEERFRSIMALSPDIISIIDENGSLTYNSPAALTIHGYTQEDMIGRNTFDLIHPEDQEQVTTAFHDLLSNPLQPLTTQYRYKNKDGSYVWMECCASNQLSNPLINGIIAISRNISERMELEESRLDFERKLMHTQKLESLGVLAGGIAHDFNNILTAIVGNAELALMRLNPESPALENLERIEKSATRAADLARQMLAYSGKGKFVVENIDLNRLVEEMGHMLEVSISKKAMLRFNLAKELPAVNADATQIRQIIMNLVINASEAIGDNDGVIAISTGCRECDEKYLQNTWMVDQVPEGRYVYIEVADTGCGMDEETMGKIFDPFFTTKFTGRGLGMAAVLGIIRGHRGTIKVNSEPGRGSSFKVLIPASGKTVELSNGQVRKGDWKGEGKILLVDDEETVRGIGSEMLKELGFTPITAEDGMDAMEIFRNTPDISCVILDLTMPKLDGEQCFEGLRQIDPQVKVIISSGYSESEVTQKFAGKGLAGFIQKPYKLSALREVLSHSMSQN